jgi:glycolate oxidase FAD binding subunit
MLVDAGATIGGTVAAGLSGPGRFRYGGIRDFLLAVNFISGDGKLIRSGGKVVKNAAGFDIPKFMVGSMGRLGVITELTFKVFPKPSATQTMQVQCASHQQAIERMTVAARSTWELDAIDYRPDQRILYLCIGGPEAPNRAIADHILDQWGSDVSVFANADDYWARLRELNWSGELPIAAKIPTTPTLAIELCEQLPGTLLLSAAANVAWQFMNNNDEVINSSDVLSGLGIKGLVVKGDSPVCCIGEWIPGEIEVSIKEAFDPTHKYPSLESTQTEANH